MRACMMIRSWLAWSRSGGGHDRWHRAAPRPSVWPGPFQAAMVSAKETACETGDQPRSSCASKRLSRHPGSLVVHDAASAHVDQQRAEQQDHREENDFARAQPSKFRPIRAHHYGGRSTSSGRDTLRPLTRVERPEKATNRIRLHDLARPYLPVQPAVLKPLGALAREPGSSSMPAIPGVGRRHPVPQAGWKRQSRLTMKVDIPGLGFRKVFTSYWQRP
jgi:hypothetical protein